MNTRKPKLSWHRASRRYYVRYRGKCHYLGRDIAAARTAYDEHMVEWATWRAQRNAQLILRPTPNPTIADVYDRFLRSREPEVAPETLLHYRSHLRRFTALYRAWPAANISAVNLQALRQDLITMGLAARSVNHEINAIKTMMRWAIDLALIPPINLRAVRTLRLDAPPVRGYSLAEVRHMIKRAPSRLKSWIRVNWLTAARPMEVLRLVFKQGEWIEQGVFTLTRGKTLNRHLVCSELALRHLKRCRPIYHYLNSYGQACRRATGLTPHPLRHGAATHLAQLGVPRTTIDAILGHLPSRTSRTYQPIDWQSLRESVSLLSL
jgi:integrase